MKIYLVLLVSLLLLSCDSKSDVEKEIEAIPMEVTIDRFDKVFGAASVENLQELKQQYPVFFPAQYPDSLWIARLQDTLQKELHAEVVKQFPDNSQLEDGLTSLFKHIKFYFPLFTTPIVYTTTSDVDYRNKVLLSDNKLVIALDTYLGSEHPFYDGIQNYTVKTMNASQIMPDVASEYARRLVSKPADRTLLAQMIYYGKELYLKDLWLPETSDADKIGFTEAEYLWAQDNSLDMWRYFVENELLYSTDTKLPPRFINPAPFSKFYLEIDNESPGMTGRFLGWQIVRSYMENNTVSVQQLMMLDADEIFKNSKYKPKK
ncbi:gliding motility lipoprotein GldB [Ulvibacter sp. MAR_2010_11]|uniref:gliding motility lipoprotein GldB n=1 Tax=Ulvibacter sp. MAR_2010_11 TaxID=1250229 RepID=UPI000C2C2030|nr:gliding motility lipoprotein GldB [Ulvibacter sp. MAR_2010_11]